MRRKELEQRLSSIKDFANPKVELEQYATRATIASDILYTAANEYDDIEDALVVDLGAGAGALTAASLYVSSLAILKPGIHVPLGPRTGGPRTETGARIPDCNYSVFK